MLPQNPQQVQTHSFSSCALPIKLDPIFHTFSKATYESHKYCIALISFLSYDIYFGRQENHRTRLSTCANRSERLFYASTVSYNLTLFNLHHMLVSSIRGHNLLQKITVNNFNERESFTLAEEQLLELRNFGTENVQVEGCERTGFVDILNLPLSEETGLVLKNVCFSVVEKWTSSTHRVNDGNVIPQFDGCTRQFGDALESLLELKGIRLDQQVIPKMVSVNKQWALNYF